jgi:hypothetical protein
MHVDRLRSLEVSSVGGRPPQLGTEDSDEEGVLRPPRRTHFPTHPRKSGRYDLARAAKEKEGA